MSAEYGTVSFTLWGLRWYITPENAGWIIGYGPENWTHLSATTRRYTSIGRRCLVEIIPSYKLRTHLLEQLQICAIENWAEKWDDDEREREDNPLLQELIDYLRSCDDTHAEGLADALEEGL